MRRESEMEAKKAVKRPLVIADLIEYKNMQFLVAFLYDPNYLIGQIVLPLNEFMKNGTSIADKLAEIVRVNCKLDEPIGFDLYTCSDTLISETLADPYILGQKKEQSECAECARVMENASVRECIDDLYIKDCEATTKETREKPQKQERKQSGFIRKTFEKVRQKVRNFIRWMQI
ncbi:hypothetical protein COK55_13810 [Bacillus cereus]|nr:hypothetical protein COK55_13810 [Bacillus cereus]